MKRIICLLATLMILTGCGGCAFANNQNKKVIAAINNAIQKNLDLEDIHFQLSASRIDDGRVTEDYDFQIQDWKSPVWKLYGVWLGKYYASQSEDSEFDVWSGYKIYVPRTGYSAYADRDIVCILNRCIDWGCIDWERDDINAWFENTPDNLRKYDFELLGAITEVITTYLKKLPNGAEVKEFRSDNGETEYEFTLTPEQFDEVFQEYVETLKQRYIAVKTGLECHGRIITNSEGYVLVYYISFQNEINDTGLDEPANKKEYHFSLGFLDPGDDVIVEQPDISQLQTFQEYRKKQNELYSNNNDDTTLD